MTVIRVLEGDQRIVASHLGIVTKGGTLRDSGQPSADEMERSIRVRGDARDEWLGRVPLPSIGSINIKLAPEG